MPPPALTWPRLNLNALNFMKIKLMDLEIYLGMLGDKSIIISCYGPESKC
jgi:hypothetical protein